MPGDEAWLIGERRATGEHKYYLSNFPTDTPITVLASTIKARWICEQAHQQLKEELGLDHFEGRSWHGLNRHALMTMVAMPSFNTVASQPRGGGKGINGPPPQPSLPAVRHLIITHITRAQPRRCPQMVSARHSRPVTTSAKVVLAAIAP